MWTWDHHVANARAWRKHSGEKVILPSVRENCAGQGALVALRVAFRV
jgi:hypothetical protein